MMAVAIVAVVIFIGMLGFVYYVQRKGSAGIRKALDAYEREGSIQRHPSSRSRDNT